MYPRVRLPSVGSGNGDTEVGDTIIKQIEAERNDSIPTLPSSISEKTMYTQSSIFHYRRNAHVLSLAAGAILMLWGTALYARGTSTGWTSVVLWDSGEKIQGVTLGDIDTDRPGTEGIGVTMSGTIGIGGLGKTGTWSDVIYQHSEKLNTALVADLDTELPGNELYVGGGGSTTPGEILQLHKNNGKWNVRSVWKGDGFVHSLAVLPPRKNGLPSLVFVTYGGQIIELSDRNREPRVLYTETLEADSNRLLFKDIVAGKINGRNGRFVFAGSKAGRGILVDADSPGSGRAIHTEAGGIARVNMDADGNIFCACNHGNVLRLQYQREHWTVDTLYRSRDELRGVGCGSFATPSGTAPIAIYGYDAFVRILFDNGTGWDTHTVWRDSDRAHSLSIGNVVPGNGSDEVLVGGYSGKLTLLFETPS